MPLIHSKSKEALHQNMRTLMDDVGKSPHVQSRQQAIAIAMNTARRAGGKFASGGAASFGERMAARSLTQGFLHSPVPGRTDKLPISVKGGSYILPADHVSALGQGNSLAGADIVNKLFKMGPYGSAPSASHGIKPTIPRLSMKAKADGGATDEPTDIIAAGGELSIPPEKIIDRFGDLDHGHRALDHWVVETRKRHVETLKGLKAPRKD